MSDLQVVRVDPHDPRWDAFVRESPQSTFCHLSRWSTVITNVLGREFIGFAAVDQAGKWHGVLPLVRVRAPLVGHSLLSMPYLNYGGPIGTTAAIKVLADAAIAEARSSGAPKLQLRCRDAIEAGDEWSVSAQKIFVTLALPSEPDALWKQFSSKLRSQIRRPEKEGMEIRFGSTELRPFYNVFARNMRDLGTPVYSRKFFEALDRNFENVVFGAVYLNGVALAAGCGFVWNGEFEMTWASSLREHNAKAPNMLLYWGFMREMIQRGVTVFNFGRSSPDAGTHRFKKQWGGVDSPLPWMDLRKDREEIESSGSVPLVFRLASAVWQKLPVAVANRVGPPIAARLPWW